MQPATIPHRARSPWLLLALLPWLPAQAALAAAGKAVFVAGEVRVERAAAPAPGLPLAQGDAILTGDIVVTGDASRAQLLMADGARIALRAGSRFQVDELRLPAAVGAPGQARAVDADGRSVTTLLKGGFRTRTGSIGKQDPAAYEVRTPVGVLGIRGTEYVAVLCQAGDCSDAPGVRPGELIRDGLYLGVFSNGIVFRATGQDPLALAPGEFLFIPLDEPGSEVLPAPPPFLLEDGQGELGLPGTPVDGPAPAAPPGAGPQELGDIGSRRAPAGEGPGAGEDGDSAAPDLPVGGTGPDGQPVDLTPGTLPPQSATPLLNDVAFGLGLFADFGTLVGSDSGNEDTILLDAGSLLAFPAQLPSDAGPLTLAFAIGSSASTDLGSASGLSWGRWSGGSLEASINGGGLVSEDLETQSLHWITREPAVEPPVLPVSGAVPFQLIGATTPTDVAGETGVIGGASLAADFTGGSVAMTLAVQINGLAWYAAGSAPLDGGPLFTGAFSSASIGGTLPVTGGFAGFLAEPAGAPGTLTAGLSWSLADLLGERPVLTGVLAFGPGSGQPLPAPQQRRDIAIAGGLQGQLGTLAGVQANQPGDYDINADLDLVRLGGLAAVLDEPLPANYAIGSAGIAESGVDPATLLRWGRWSGGIAEVTDDLGNTIPLDLQQASLHWVTSPNADNPPVLPQSGLATYSLVGATTPTSNAGETGVLGAATFSADFTNQQVESTISLQMGPNTWQATGAGSIGGQAGLPDHQFSGFYEGVLITGPTTDVGFGDFSGFFSGPGASALLPDLPGGAGLTYSLSDSDIVETIQGILIFQSPRD